MLGEVEHMEFIFPLLKEVLVLVGGKRWKEKWKWPESRTQPPFLCQGWRVGLGIGRWGFGYCVSPPFFLFYFSQQFSCSFLYFNMHANTCSLQMAAWRDWGLRLTTDLWPLAERGNAPIEGMRLWCWKSISLPPTSSKREVTDLLSSPIWTRVPLQTLSWVKPWFMSEVHFCVGLEPVQVFLACACHQWSKVAALARISTLCQGSKRWAWTPTHKGLLNGAKSRDLCRPWSKCWWKWRTCVAQNNFFFLISEQLTSNLIILSIALSS